MLRFELYDVFLSGTNVYQSNELVSKFEFRKDNRIYDIRSLRPYLKTSRVLAQYNTDIYTFVSYLKSLITNQLTPLECRGVRSLEFLGVKMNNRLPKQYYTDLVVGRRLPIEHMQIIDISPKLFLHDRFETVTYVEDVRDKAKNNVLSVQNLLNMSFSDKYLPLVKSYISNFQRFLPDYTISLTHPILDGCVTNALTIMDKQTNSPVNFFELDLAQDDTLTLAVMLLPYLFLYPNVSHRTIFLDTPNLSGNEEFYATLLKFLKSPVLRPQTIVLY